MADVLALSWDRRRLTGLEVSVEASTQRVSAGFSVDWPESPPTASWLKETLRRAGITARHVALALPREDVVLRLLELPNVSDDELPTLVRFQAAARSAQSVDELLLDYLPLPMRPGVAQKDVWLATALQTTVDPIRVLLTEAGLELVQLTLSSLCLTELIAREEAKQSLDPASSSLVVLRDGARMELAVICQRQLIAAHAVKWPSVNDIPPVTKMLAEVSRVLVQVQAWLPEGTLQRAWVVGEDADVGELPDALSQRWKCPVQRFDSWRDNHFPQSVTKFEGSASQYAIAGGLALIQSASLTPKIDLLHPRQPPPKRDPRKPIIAAVSAAALLTAVLGFSGIQLGLSSYDYAINELKEQDNRQKKDLTAGGPVFVASQALQDWQARNINQLQQMNELYQLMNGTKREVIADYRFDPAPGEVLGKLTANGNAKDRSDAEQLQQRLADLPKYRVRPKPTNQSTRDADYSSRFELDIDLRSETKSAKTAKPATVVPKASNTE